MNRLASTWSRTPRGIEILTPRPGQLRVLLLLAAVAGALLAGWVGLVGGFDALGAALALFVDTTVLALLLPTLAVLLWFDRRSAEWAVFGGEALVEEQRVGRWVVHRTTHPLSAVAEVDCRPERTGDAWCVGWRRTQGDVLARPLAVGLDEAQARELASTLQAWLAAPSRTVEVREGRLGVEWPRVVARLLATRAVTAVPLLVAAGAAVVLSVLWQLRDAKYADAPAYDATAEGRLLALQWVLHPPDAADLARGQVQAVGDLRLGVEYLAADGIARRLWWRSSEAMPVDYLAEMRFDPVARLVGLPRIELQVPAEAAVLMTPAGGTPSFAHWPAEPPPGAEAVHAWLDRFDDALALVAALRGTVAPDWRVAYRSEDPADATLLRLATLDAEAARGLPLPLLLVLAALAAGVLLASLGLVVRRAWIAWLLGLALLAGLPWWAPHGSRIATWFGVAQSMGDGLRRFALAIGSQRAGDAGYQLVPVIGEPPAADGVLVQWTLADSGVGTVATLLGLDEPLPADVDFAQRREALAERAAQRIAALDDTALVELVRRWEPDEFGRLSSLRVPYVEGVCRAWRQDTRSPDTRRWLEWSLSNPAICDH
jgi:hypothetical protein